MKKVLLVVVLAALASAAFLLVRRHQGAAHAATAAAWLPAGTIFFDEVPDFHRTEQRWPGTALAQILHEPQVQAFLEKPRAALPEREQITQHREQLRKIDPTQFFLALTEWAGPNSAPKGVMGLSYAGSKDDLAALVAQVRKGALKLWPEAKSDIVKDASGEEVETFAVKGATAALAYRGHWLFLASDVGTLQATLDAYHGKGPQEALVDLPAFKTCLAQMPDAPDAVAFLQPKTLADHLDSLMAMAQPNGNPHAMDSLRKIDGLAVAAKMDGELMREALFSLTSQKIESAALANQGLNLTTEATLLYSDFILANLRTGFDAQSGFDVANLPPDWQPFLKSLSAQGITLDSFLAAFGPESSFLIDWPVGSPIPVPLFTIDVHDAAQAHSFLDKLIQAIPAGQALAKQDVDGATYYSLPATSMGFFPLQATAGLSDKFFAVGLTLQAVQDAMKRAGGPGKLGDAAPYKDVMAKMQAPTLSSAYIDDKAIFQRVYNLLRGVASMGLIPHVSDAVDLNKLPETDTIARHLSPMGISTSAKGGGYLMQTVGPIPAYQGTIFALGAAVGAAVPYMIQHNLGGSFGVPAARPFPPALPATPAPPLPAAAPTLPAAAPSSSAAVPAPATPSAAPDASPAGSPAE